MPSKKKIKRENIENIENIQKTVKKRHTKKSKIRSSNKQKRSIKRERKERRDKKRREKKREGEKSGSFKYLNCSPLSEQIVVRDQDNGNKPVKSCYNKEGLLRIRDKWNLRNPDRKIISDDPNQIWNDMKNRMENVCDNEMCWVRQQFIEHDNKPLIDNFSPKAPESWKKNPSEWLSSTDIIKIMKQYERTYPNFRFIGPSAIDFDKVIDETENVCVYDDLCNFNIHDFLKKNVNKIGIVFNTDPHTKGGSHWIALFIDIKRGIIYYFDSNGSSMPGEVKRFIERIQGQFEQLVGNTLKEGNNVGFTHQRKDGQCGMYVIYFIVELLTENTPPEKFNTERITDEQMEKYRTIIYN